MSKTDPPLPFRAAITFWTWAVEAGTYGKQILRKAGDTKGNVTA